MTCTTLVTLFLLQDNVNNCISICKFDNPVGKRMNYSDFRLQSGDRIMVIYARCKESPEHIFSRAMIWQSKREDDQTC
jgi:hypothetical protein